MSREKTVKFVPIGKIRIMLFFHRQFFLLFQGKNKQIILIIKRQTSPDLKKTEQMRPNKYNKTNRITMQKNLLQ